MVIKRVEAWVIGGDLGDANLISSLWAICTLFKHRSGAAMKLETIVCGAPRGSIDRLRFGDHSILSWTLGNRKFKFRQNTWTWYGTESLWRHTSNKYVASAVFGAGLELWWFCSAGGTRTTWFVHICHICYTINCIPGNWHGMSSTSVLLVACSVWSGGDGQQKQRTTIQAITSDTGWSDFSSRFSSLHSMGDSIHMEFPLDRSRGSINHSTVQHGCTL